jgi:hypothetical protein
VRDARRYDGDVSSPATAAPVLSLTVLDSASLSGGVLSGDSRVLAVVRSEIANPTHPNVVSVPTQRVPRTLLDAILASAVGVAGSPSPHVAHFHGGTIAGDSATGHNPLVYAVEALLARKLGLAEALEGGRTSFRAALRARVDGVAVYDNLGPGVMREPVRMLNVAVELAGFAHDLPTSTNSYSSIRWTPVDQMLRCIATKDPTLIDPAFSPIEICVHGVCLLAAQATLARGLGGRLFGDVERRESAAQVVEAGAPVLAAT